MLTTAETPPPWGRRVGCDVRGAALVVDDVGDFAEVVEGDGDHVVEADVGRDRELRWRG